MRVTYTNNVCIRIASHFCQYLLLSFLLKLWMLCAIVVLICISITQHFSFHLFICHFYLFLLWSDFPKSFIGFVSLLLSCMGYFHIMDTNLLSCICSANIFFLSLWSILLIVSFDKQKLKNFLMILLSASF